MSPAPFRRRLSQALRRIDDEGGAPRDALRWVWGTPKTMRDSARARSIVSTRWSARDQRWHYARPEGRAVDEGRWAKLCALNEWPHVEPVQVAVTDHVGTVTMSSDRAWIAGNIFQGGDVTVPTATIDALCAQRGIAHVEHGFTVEQRNEGDLVQRLYVDAGREA